jgi:hypothetical protein
VKGFAALGAASLASMSFCGFGRLAWANGSPPAELAKLDSPLLSWSELQSMHLFGVQAYSQSFTSQASLQQATQSLAARGDLFQAVIVLKNKMLLSGTKLDWHWVAEISSTAQGVQGLVSAMPINRAQPGQGPQTSQSRRFGWLPRPIHLHFSQQVSVEGRKALQQLYSVPLALPALQAYLQASLKRMGWIHESGIGGLPGSSVWYRTSSRLTVFTQGDPNGSTLFVHYLE